MPVDISRTCRELPVRHTLLGGAVARRFHGQPINQLSAVRRWTGASADLMQDQVMGRRMFALATPAPRHAQSAAKDANHGAQPPPKLPAA